MNTHRDCEADDCGNYARYLAICDGVGYLEVCPEHALDATDAFESVFVYPLDDRIVEHYCGPEAVDRSPTAAEYASWRFIGRLNLGAEGVFHQRNCPCCEGTHSILVATPEVSL